MFKCSQFFSERRDPSSSSSQLEKQDSAESSVFNERMVEDALRALIESIRHRSGILSMWGPNNKAPSSSGHPSSNNGPHEEPGLVTNSIFSVSFL